MTTQTTTTLADALSFVEVALIIFFCVFLLIVVWVLLKRPGAFSAASRIPLEDETVMTPRDKDTQSDTRGAD